MRFQPADENRRNRNELAVSELRMGQVAPSYVCPRFMLGTHLAILERSRVERHGTVSKKCLDFCYKQVALFEKIPHLELVALQLSTLKCRQTHRHQRKSDIRSLDIPTWTPPGRLTDESMRTASCRALASTFHLRGCTFLLSLRPADTSMSKIRTSVIRPITRSPTSGLYLRGKWINPGRSI